MKNTRQGIFEQSRFERIAWYIWKNIISGTYDNAYVKIAFGNLHYHRLFKGENMARNLHLTRPLPENVHPAEVFLKSRRSDSTRRTVKRHLNQIARMLLADEKVDATHVNWGALRYANTSDIRSRLIAADKYKPSTINSILSALRGVLRQAWLLEQMTAEDYHRAIIIENLKDKKGEVTGRKIAFAEIQGVADVCFRDKTDAGARDSAIIGLIATCGLRRSEVVQLTLTDVDTETGKVTVRSTTTKSNAERIVWLRGGALLAMEDWLFVRNPLEVNAVFVPINKGGNQQDHPLTDQSIYEIVKKRGKEAAVENFTPHDFRRTMITNMLETHVDVFLVQELAGHVDTNTTKRYDMRDEKHKRAAVERLHYPHRSRRQKTLL